MSIKWSETGYHWETAAELAVPALDVGGRPDGRGRPPAVNLNVPNVPLDEVLGVREAKLAPYGEFWVASSDIRSGDLRIEFQGPAAEFDEHRRRARGRGLRHRDPTARDRRLAAQGSGRIGRERARHERDRRRTSHTALINRRPYTSTVPTVDQERHPHGRCGWPDRPPNSRSRTKPATT